jgi:hypothetical protein
MTDALCGLRLSFSRSGRIINGHAKTLRNSPADSARAAQKAWRCAQTNSAHPGAQAWCQADPETKEGRPAVSFPLESLKTGS